MEERGFNWMPIGLAIGMAVGLSLFLFYKADPPSPPSNDAIFGCYIADEAPTIRLDDAGMHIRQGAFDPIRYHLERHKTGIALVAEKPIEARLGQGGYSFTVAAKGEGKFLPFFRDGGDTRYGVFDDDGLQNFEMIANDGRYLLYRLTEAAACTDK